MRDPSGFKAFDFLVLSPAEFIARLQA